MFIAASYFVLYYCTVCAGEMCVLDMVDAADSGSLGCCAVDIDVGLLRLA